MRFKSIDFNIITKFMVSQKSNTHTSKVYRFYDLLWELTTIRDLPWRLLPFIGGNLCKIDECFAVDSGISQFSNYSRQFPAIFTNIHTHKEKDEAKI
jgi:hypothetical protein